MTLSRKDDCQNEPLFWMIYYLIRYKTYIDIGTLLKNLRKYLERNQTFHLNTK